MKTILIADDDEMLMDLYSLKFTKEGYRVLAASGKQELLGHLQTAKPDFILLDRRLGNEDGFAIFKELRAGETTKNIPVFLLTNQDPEAAEFAAVKASPPCEYLVKEKIDIGDLVAKVKSIVG